MKRIPSDTFVAMLYFIPQDKSLLTNDCNKIHEAIYNMREQVVYDMGYRFPLLKDMPFSTNGICPDSQLLTSALSRLGLSRILIRDEDFNYIITECGRTYMKEKILPLFSQDEQEELKGMAKEFSSKCSIYLS